MAIRLHACELLTPNTAVFLAARKFFVSCRLRIPIDADPSSNGSIVSRKSVGTFNFVLKSGSVADGWGTFEVSLLGSPQRRASTRIPLGMANHVALVYDADDPTAQGVYFNGIYKPLDGSGNNYDIGSSQGGIRLYALGALDCVVEELVVGRDVVPTRSQVHDLGWLTAATGGVVDDLIAAGAMAYRWTLRGAEGSPAAAGEPGATSTGTAAWAFTPASGSATYAADLDPINAVVFGEPTVMSSGLAVDVPLFAQTDAGLITAKVVANDPARWPTFAVNGAPVQPIHVLSAGSNYDGLLCLLSESDRIASTDVVTWSAPDGFVAAEVGASPAVVDQPVRNRVGKTTYAPDSPPTMRVGVNHTLPGPTYYAGGYQLQANRALNMHTGSAGPGSGNRRDGGKGTLTIPVNGILIDSIDTKTPPKEGRPAQMGLRPLAWTDHGESPDNTDLPCEFSLVGDGYGVRVAKIDAMSRNEVLSDGSVRKVRVYEYSRYRVEVTLSEAIDATTTTIPISSFGGIAVPGTTHDMVLELPGETITAPTRAGSPNRLTGCVRGVKGTAQSHAAGTVCYLGTTQWGGNPTLNLTGTAGKINYSDLVLLGPEDWTPPAEGEPTPLVYVDPLEFSAEYKRQIASGLGIVRFMDSTPVGAIAFEPEHVMDPSNTMWGTPTDNIGGAVVGARPFAAGEGKWVYVRHEAPNSQTYPVELLAPLDAVAAGTKQTIEVEGTEANPILIGSRLIAGSEVMRVISGSNTTWLVERGAALTTPAAHDAGTINAGWRLPYLSPSVPGANVIHFELEFAGNHNFNTGLFYDAGGMFTWGSDINVAARRSGTLAADVDATQPTIPVAFAEADWPWIAPGLTVTFGSETRTIVSVDQAAGTITVTSSATRSSGSTHLAGAAVTTKSNRLLCESTDGTKREWQTVLNYAYDSRVTGPKTVGLHRSADGDPECVLVVPGQQIDTLVYKDSAPTPSYPYELVAKAANEARAWLLLNIPGFATDDFIIEQARRIRDALNPGSVVFVELANETWNFGYPTYGPYGTLAALGGIGGVTDYTVLRSKRVCDLVKAVFAETGRAGEIRHYLPWQSGNIGTILAAARRNNVDVDASGCAPYINPKDTTGFAALCTATNDDGAVADAWAFALRRYVGSNSDRARIESDNRNRKAHVALTGRPLMMVHYEGGMDKVIPGDGATPQTRARNRDVRYHPNWCFAELDHHWIIQNFSEGDAIAIFNNAQGPYGDASRPNTGEYLWGMNVWWGQPAGPGNGSDGGIDNRLNTYRQGLPQSKTAVDNGDMKESVRWFAMGRYNTAFFAGLEPDPEDVTPPAITTTTPADGAVGVSVDAAIEATFSEAVTPGTIAFGLEAGGTAVPASAAYNAGTLAATLTPNAPLDFATDYTATVSGAADLAGNVMAPVSWSFRTADAPPDPDPDPDPEPDSPDPTKTEAEIRAAVAAALAALPAFDGAYSGAFARVDGQSSEDLRAVAIEPMDSVAVSAWDDGIGGLYVDCRTKITLIARDQCGETCDEIAGKLFAAAFNALFRSSLGGLVLPAHSFLNRWTWRDAKAPERRIEAIFQCRYLIDSYLDEQG